MFNTFYMYVDFVENNGAVTPLPFCLPYSGRGSSLFFCFPILQIDLVVCNYDIHAIFSRIAFCRIALSTIVLHINCFAGSICSFVALLFIHLTFSSMAIQEKKKNRGAANRHYL